MIYATVDARTFYTLYMEIYLNKQPKDNQLLSPTMLSVLRPIQPITGTGRNAQLTIFSLLYILQIICIQTTGLLLL